MSNLCCCVSNRTASMVIAGLYLIGGVCGIISAITNSVIPVNGEIFERQDNGAPVIKKVTPMSASFFSVILIEQWISAILAFIAGSCLLQGVRNNRASMVLVWVGIAVIECFIVVAFISLMVWQSSIDYEGTTIIWTGPSLFHKSGFEEVTISQDEASTIHCVFLAALVFFVIGGLVHLYLILVVSTYRQEIIHQVYNKVEINDPHMAYEGNNTPRIPLQQSQYGENRMV